MLVTLLGIVILVRAVQPENAVLPMLVTLLGIVMLVKDVQFLNVSYLDISFVVGFKNI